MAKAEVTSVALQSLGLENNWFIDNGANSHSYGGPKEALINYRPLLSGRCVGGIGGMVPVLGIGDIMIRAQLATGDINQLTISNV